MLRIPDSSVHRSPFTVRRFSGRFPIPLDVVPEDTIRHADEVELALAFDAFKRPGAAQYCDSTGRTRWRRFRVAVLPDRR